MSMPVSLRTPIVEKDYPIIFLLPQLINASDNLNQPFLSLVRVDLTDNPSTVK